MPALIHDVVPAGLPHERPLMCIPDRHQRDNKPCDDAPFLTRLGLAFVNANQTKSKKEVSVK